MNDLLKLEMEVRDGRKNLLKWLIVKEDLIIAIERSIKMVIGKATSVSTKQRL